MPLMAALITCSIFMDSMTKSWRAAMNGVALAHVDRNDRPLHRRGDGDGAIGTVEGERRRGGGSGGICSGGRIAGAALAVMEHGERIAGVYARSSLPRSRLGTRLAAPLVEADSKKSRR